MSKSNNNIVRIAMLGGQGAGKTCFMLGMYSMMQTGIEGFYFSAKEADSDLDLNELWSKLVKTKNEDRWPFSTADTKQYCFDFRYQGELIAEFEWNDYRGTALTDKMDQKNVGELFKLINSSTCLLLCISGELLNRKADAETQIATLSNRINYLLTQYIKDNKPTESDPLSVGIVLTKYDQCSRSKEEVLEDITQVLFPNLFKAGWHVMICSTNLGLDLAKSGEDNGKISPQGFYLPVIFALYAKLVKDVRKHDLEKKELGSTYNELQKKGFLWNIFNDGKGQKLNTEKQLTEITNDTQQINRNLENMRKIFLKDVTIFKNGKILTSLD